MAIKKAIKRVARKTKNTVKWLAKKRYGTFKKPKYVNLVSDVAKAAIMLNAEKKRFLNTSATPVPVGQVNINSSGNIVQDITPVMVQGVTYNTRNGASIKLTSAFFRFQFYQQGSRSSAMRIKMYFIRVKGSPQTTTEVQSQFLQTNPFVSGSIYDLNSNRNPDFFNQYEVLRTKSIYLKDDNTTNDIVIKDIKVGMKFGKGHHVRFDKDSNTVTQGQLILYIVADSGNISTTTGSTISNIPISGISTGALFNFNHTFYYYDN